MPISTGSPPSEPREAAELSRDVEIDLGNVLAGTRSIREDLDRKLERMSPSERVLAGHVKYAVEKAIDQLGRASARASDYRHSTNTRL